MKDIINVPFSPPDITASEINEIVDTLKSGWITTGAKTKKLEQKLAEFIGVNSVVCFNSGTAAMELTLRILGIGPGDEVITSAYTYTASAAVIDHVGAKIVLVDTAKDSFEMDLDKLKNAITKKTKMIIPVDIAGKMNDYDEIYKIINEKKSLFEPNGKYQEIIGRIIVLEDAAHALGAKYKDRNCGKVSDFTAFSFHAVKNLTTAEGGAVTWRNDLGLDDDEIYKQFMLYGLHGQTKDAYAKTEKGAWEYDIMCLGYKCNMTDILASMGLAQLERYKDMLIRRHEIVQMYNLAFKSYNVKYIDHIDDKGFSSGHLYLARIPGINVEQRNKIILEMAQAGIATNVHYKPLPMFTAYKNQGFDIKNFPNAYAQYENEITLPLNSLLTTVQIDHVISTFIESIENIKRN